MIGRKMEERIREKETECRMELAQIVPLASSCHVSREDFDRVLAPPADAPAPAEPRRKRGAFGRFFHFLGLAVLVLGLSALLAAAGCQEFRETPVQFCYIHPKYGEVCVSIGGKRYKIDRPDLSPEQKTDVENWLKTQP